MLSSRKKKFTVIGLIAVIIILVIIYRIPETFSFLFPSIPQIQDFNRVRLDSPRRSSRSIVTSTPILFPSPSPIPLPHSMKSFTVGGGNRPGPKFTRGYLDPYGPFVGDTQKISVTAYFDTSINSINAVVTTDNKSATVPLSRTQGSDIFGTWEGTWQVSDTTDSKYKINFEAASGTQTSQLEINLR